MAIPNLLLQDAVLPWKPCERHRTFLINDSVETDGRFLLHSLASTVLLNSNTKRQTKQQQQEQSRLYWITCGPWTEALIASSLNKMAAAGGGAAGSISTSSSNKTTKRQQSDGSATDYSKPLTIRSVNEEIAERALLLEEDDDDKQQIDMQDYVREIFRELKAWVEATATASVDSAEQQETSQERTGVEPTQWVILDDVSALACLVGERLAYGLVMSIHGLANKQQSVDSASTTENNEQQQAFGIAIRCSNDVDQRLHLQQEQQPNWIGAGGASYDNDNDPNNEGEVVCWERTLVEMADGIIDVVPLESGYSREIHGRLYLSDGPAGQGWGGTGRTATATTAAADSTTSSTTQVVNYRFADNNEIVAFRVSNG